MTRPTICRSWYQTFQLRNIIINSKQIYIQLRGMIYMYCSKVLTERFLNLNKRQPKKIRVPVKCGMRQKRNRSKQNETNRNETIQIETERNETKQNEMKQSKTKRNKSKLNETNEIWVLLSISFINLLSAKRKVEYGLLLVCCLHEIIFTTLLCYLFVMISFCSHWFYDLIKAGLRKNHEKRKTVITSRPWRKVESMCNAEAKHEQMFL